MEGWGAAGSPLHVRYYSWEKNWTGRFGRSINWVDPVGWSSRAHQSSDALDLWILCSAFRRSTGYLLWANRFFPVEYNIRSGSWEHVGCPGPSIWCLEPAGSSFPVSFGLDMDQPTSRVSGGQKKRGWKPRICACGHALFQPTQKMRWFF